VASLVLPCDPPPFLLEVGVLDALDPQASLAARHPSAPQLFLSSCLTLRFARSAFPRERVRSLALFHHLRHSLDAEAING
jgi:hypothetical protein